jgi:hypothetical protein
VKIAGRIIWRLVFLAIFGAILYALGLVNWSEVERSFRVESADVRVEVQDDASLRVTEQLTFDFDGVRARRRDWARLVRPARDVRRRAAHHHGA